MQGCLAAVIEQCAEANHTLLWYELHTYACQLSAIVASKGSSCNLTARAHIAARCASSADSAFQHVCRVKHSA